MSVKNRLGENWQPDGGGKKWWMDEIKKRHGGNESRMFSDRQRERKKEKKDRSWGQTSSFVPALAKQIERVRVVREQTTWQLSVIWKTFVSPWQMWVSVRLWFGQRRGWEDMIQEKEEIKEELTDCYHISLYVTLLTFLDEKEKHSCDHHGLFNWEWL